MIAKTKAAIGGFFLVLIASSCCSGQRLDLYEGDICKQDQGTLWTCRPLKDCAKAQELLRKRQRPQMCNFIGAGSDSVVCCEPDVKPAAIGAKSQQMCKKYGDAVFIRLPDPLNEGYSSYDSCATVEPLITNGKNAEPREFPHMALIGYGNKNAIDWLCGGTLISERFVLSAGHCTDAGNRGLARWVRLGEYNLQSRRDDETGLAQPVDMEIVQRINHPDYRPPSVYNDIALYRLGKDVEFNEYVRPICLHTTHTFAKTYAIATGWGRTQTGGRSADTLQKGNVTLTPRKECSDSWESAVSSRLQEGIKDASMMCAGDLINGVDTCQGDSGGPLQLRLNEPYCMYSQIAITSFGAKCASNRPGVYTRVSHYVPWIESVVWP